MTEFKEEVSNVVTEQQVMTLADEVQGESFERLGETPIVSGEALENRTHNIRDFLTRFVQIDVVSITESMAQNHVVASHGFPSTLIKKEMVAEKLSGFKYLRGSIVVRVQVNSQIMQCGALQCMMMPVESPSDIFNSQVSTSILNASQVPGGMLLISKGNVFEYTQPFVYPTTAYDMTIAQPDYVTMIIKVLSPLRGNGEDITLTVFARFDEDVEVSMPTSIPLYLAPDLLFSQLKRIRMDEETSRKVDGLAEVFRIMRGIQNQGLGETPKPAGGPISGVLSTVGNIGTMLAGSGIPVLSEVGAIGSMIGGIGSTIASAFGFSKPDNNATQNLTFPSIFKGVNNSNYSHTHHQMALDVQNKLSIDRHPYGTPVDEMAIAACTRTPSLIRTYNLTNTKAAGSLLWKQVVTPMYFEAASFTTEAAVDMSSIAFATSAFEFWRGSLNYTFVFVKTVFHSCRLMVVWIPSDDPVPEQYNDVLAKNFSVMIDLSEEKMEQGISIPYIQALQWLSTVNTKYRYSNGHVAVYLINKLVNASNSSPSIDILTYLHAGQDFEVAIPRTPAIFDGRTQYGVVPKSIAPGVWKLKLKNAPQNGQNVVIWTSPTGATSEGSFDCGTISNTCDSPGPIYNVEPNVCFVSGSVTPFSRIRFWVNSETIGVLFPDSIPLCHWQEEIPFLNKIVIEVSYLEKMVLRNLESVNQINRTECIAGLDNPSVATGEKISTPARNVTIGEEVKSIRALIKRNHPIAEYHEVTIDGKTWIVVNALTPVTSAQSTSVPYKDFFLPAFRFQSGSMRYYLLLKNSIANNLMLYFIPNAFTLTQDPSKMNTSQVQFVPVIEGVCKIEIPYYNRNVVSIVGDLETFSDLQQTFHLLVFEKPTDDWELQVSAGEDFSMGYYIGAPQMRITGVITST